MQKPQSRTRKPNNSPEGSIIVRYRCENCGAAADVFVPVGSDVFQRMHGARQHHDTQTRGKDCSGWAPRWRSEGYE